jgi:hypothetical protein
MIAVDLLTFVAVALCGWFLWRIARDVRSLRWWSKAIHSQVKKAPAVNNSRRRAAPGPAQPETET